ncbi:sigma-54-dependent transcriptional regulator [Rhodopirellula sallentina]|uniref:Two component, sigma54 specific, Fis family transcriptional regulator n=1 Tax=Rhodopirellula sallentina SM41 TaxID=1263870 RepID=M5UAE5_9BACT|nr:sigma-54 dependent transcriptional regulator [Rhodopirellula sallentina]EMI52988.1 two component, sigma54 specific, Fis family transcriptional regulator [Rhodopirellula sallentina SM41]
MPDPDPFGVLIVDDEPNIRSGLARGLADDADVIETAGDAEEALAKIDGGNYPLVIVDVRLNCEMSGIELLERIVAQRPQTAVIVITAHGTVETAVDAMRAGAFDFILKPLDLNLVRQQVRKAREHYQLRVENQQLKSRLADSGQISNIVAGGAAMQDVFRQIRQVAATDATVMIQGESGTGKELIARALHDLSERSTGPFVAVNLGALPETLLESELFGHEKGAFSGASRRKPGCFEQASHGTLFLDEVTEMSAKSQVDLLRVLESRQFTRVGGEQVLTSDARVVSATNRSVQQMVDEGAFREDLFYRLNVIPIELPPLRGRRDDIPLLAEHFLEQFCTRHGRPQKTFAADAMKTMMSAPWPGNVRQLRNVIERMVLTSAGDVIEQNELPSELSKPAGSGNTVVGTLADAVEACERQTIEAALRACGMHREKTANMLGVSVRTLHYKMGRFGLR